VAVAFDTLDTLRAHIGECRRCTLSESRTTIVFGAGDPHARIMLVGEAPGKNEDLTGTPFVGAAGKLLDELLATAGLSRDDVYIANILKCRPPGNRDPRPLEVQTCTPFLDAQLALVKPDIVVTLGNYATRFVLGTAEGITTLRGRMVTEEGRHIYPVFHPAATIYDRSKRDILAEDFARLPQLLESLGSTPC